MKGLGNVVQSRVCYSTWTLSASLVRPHSRGTWEEVSGLVILGGACLAEGARTKACELEKLGG